jgi:sugar phosphate isomerase/epimerase
MYSRRHFGQIALAAIPAGAVWARINSVIRGVRIGVQSYSFRDRPLDGAIQGMVDIGLGDCELFATGHVEPTRLSREELRKWRETVSLDVFRAVRKKFDDAGISLAAYNYSFRDDFSDLEIDRGFDMGKALGVNTITASSTISCAKRLVPFAEKYQMTVAFHGHSDTKHPNEFSKPESFTDALSMTKWFAVNLDIGHFTAAGYDPVDFIQMHSDRIVILHLKDRKQGDGPNMPWGQGDTRIKEVLRLLRDRKYPIGAFIEYEYKGADDSVTEVRRCFQYCKDALAG